MTLNTFHLAGHGAANVTLGIPRLREIVMTASAKPMTPTMKLPLREDISDKDIEAFVKQVSRLTLSQVIERVTVTERLSSRSQTEARLRKYTVLLEFYPPEEYQEEYELSPEQLHEALAFNLSWRLKKELVHEMRVAAKTIDQDKSVGVGLKVRGNDLAEDEDGPNRDEETGEITRRGRDDELDENDDMDAGQAKRLNQARPHEYDDDEAEGIHGANGLADLEDYVERQLEEDDDEDEEGVVKKRRSQNDDEGMDIDAGEKAAKDAQADLLADTFKTGAKYATSFSFDVHGGKSAQFDLEVSLRRRLRSGTLANEFFSSLPMRLSFFSSTSSRESAELPSSTKCQTSVDA
jgi:DNA-directed RNA polymerase I subunit RPA1